VTAIPRRIVAALMTAMLGGALAAAQQQPSTPTFRAETRLIEVDVIVTDRDGQVVRNLTKDDFQILEDGQPQAITSFSFTDRPMPVRQARGAAPAPERDTTTNTGATAGRVYVILMDSPSTSGPGNGDRLGPVYDEFARRFAREFVENHLSPSDTVAVVHVQGSVREGQELTTNRRLVLDAIGRYGRGQSGASAAPAYGPEMVARNYATYRALQDVAERLGAMGGRRKAILWVGGQIRFDPSTAGCPTDEIPPRPDPQAMCAIRRSSASLLAAYRDAIGTATRNNVSVFPIDPSGLSPAMGIGELERQAALRMVAEDTGGRAVVNTNDLEKNYSAIVQDTSTYYLLAYAPTTAHRDGKFHRIEVRTRPGLRVRARPGYFAPGVDASPAAPSRPEAVSTRAVEALRTPIAQTGLDINLFNAPFRGSDKEGLVIIGGQISGALQLASDDQMMLAYQVFQEGRVVKGEYQVFTLNLQPGTRARVEERGLRWIGRLALPPGLYELRLVADQENGRLGSLVVPVEVPEFTNLSISGVVVGAAGADLDFDLRDDVELRRVLGSGATALRRFEQGDVITAFFEVYTAERPASPDDITITGIVTDRDGKEVKSESASPTRGQPFLPGRGTGYTLELSLSELPPAEYVLTVEATWRGDSVRRQVPFVVSP
jgi:VWFA-related protein